MLAGIEVVCCHLLSGFVLSGEGQELTVFYELSG